MSKAFDTTSIHKLIRMLLQTNILYTIIRFIENDIKGRNAYTTYRNYTSVHQYKTGVPQGGVIPPTLFNIYTADSPPRRTLVQGMSNADDITITSAHTNMIAEKKYIQPYLHKVFAWTKHNNITLNQDKTTCTRFTPDPAEYTSNMYLKIINNTALTMAIHPKVLGLTLDLKLTYSRHIHNISVHAHKSLQIIKALTATGWGKQKKTLIFTYKLIMRSALKYVSSIWSPLASSTSINKLQVMQNAS